MTSVLDRMSARDILTYGLQDWVDLGFARQYVRDEVGPVAPEELREHTLEVVAGLLDAGLMEAGDVWRGFTPWPGGPAAALVRMRAEWDVPDAPLHPGEVCWLQITEAGEPLARRIEIDRPALDRLEADIAETVRVVLARRAPDVLRELEFSADPSTTLRDQVVHALTRELVSREGLQPDHEPTPYGRWVDDAIGAFLERFPRHSQNEARP